MMRPARPREKWTKPNRLDGRRPRYEGWFLKSYLVRHSIIAAALIVSGIVWGLGQGWLVLVIFILALGAILWWGKLRADAARDRRRKE